MRTLPAYIANHVKHLENMCEAVAERGFKQDEHVVELRSKLKDSLRDFSYGMYNNMGFAFVALRDGSAEESVAVLAAMKILEVCGSIIRSGYLRHGFTDDEQKKLAKENDIALYRLTGRDALIAGHRGKQKESLLGRIIMNFREFLLDFTDLDYRRFCNDLRESEAPELDDEEKNKLCKQCKSVGAALGGVGNLNKCKLAEVRKAGQMRIPESEYDLI